MQPAELSHFSHLELTSALDALPSGVVVIDSSSTIVYANQFVRDLAQHGPEIVGMPAALLFPDLAISSLSTPRALASPDGVRLCRSDGFALEVDVLVNSTVVESDTYVVASLVERRHQSADDRFARFVESAPVMMFSLSPDGVIRSTNPAFERRTGWRSTDLVGTHFAPLVHPEDLTDAITSLSRILGGEEIDDDEVRILTAEGDYVLTQTHVVPLSSAADGGTVIGIAHDITDRVRAERELDAVKERFRQAFKQAPLAAALLSPEGEITNANHAMCVFLGYPRDELIGRAFSSFVHPDDVTTDRDLARHLHDDLSPQHVEDQRYVTKSGDVRSGSVTSATILSDEGRPLYVMRMIEDVTEKRRHLRELTSHAALALERLSSLTPREREVLDHLSDTTTAAEIGLRIFVSTRTVESHLGRAYRKLGVRSRAEAIGTYARLKDVVARFQPSLPSDLVD